MINEHFRGVADGKPYFGRVVIKGGGDAPATARSVLELGEADYAWNLQVEPEILAGMIAGGKGTVISAFSTMVERIMVNQTNPDPSLGDDRSDDRQCDRDLQRRENIGDRIGQADLADLAKHRSPQAP